MSDRPDIQLIANVVVFNPGGQVLLTREDAGQGHAARWWLPGAELAPYEHPDAACQRALTELGLRDSVATLHHVESFRGRRGWHVMFNYHCPATADKRDAQGGASWHSRSALPATAHGPWEAQVIGKVCGPAA
jgi:ADP-ribose pyrophosphatase YjhB (NUDIX family)